MAPNPFAHTNVLTILVLLIVEAYVTRKNTQTVQYFVNEARYALN